MKNPAQPLSKKHVHAIGQMVVNATRLESIILDLLAIFMKTEVINAVIAFAPQQVSNKIDTLKALYSFGMTDKEAKQDHWMKKFSEAKDLADFRNTVVHAYWTLNDSGKPTAVRYRSRGFFERHRKPISAQEIFDKAREALALEIELRGLRNHLRNPSAKNRLPFSPSIEHV